MLEQINYDCICEIVKILSIKNWNIFRSTSHFTKNITDFLDISKLNNTIDIEIGSKKINGKLLPIHYTGEYTKRKNQTKIYKHGLGIYTVPIAKNSQNIYKGEFYNNRLQSHVIVYKRSRIKKNPIVNHFYEINDIKNRFKYSGGWLNGNPHGDGLLIKKNRQYLSEKGHWKNGIKDGLFQLKGTFTKTKTNSGVEIKGDYVYYVNYKNGIKDGLKILYSNMHFVEYEPFKFTMFTHFSIKDKNQKHLLYKGNYVDCKFISFQIFDEKKPINPFNFQHEKCGCQLCKQLILFKSKNKIV